VKYPDPEDYPQISSLQETAPSPIYLVRDFESFLSQADGDEAYYDRGTRVSDERRVCGFACHHVTDIIEYQTDAVVFSAPDTMLVFYDLVMKETKLSAKF